MKSLQPTADRLAHMVREHSHQFKRASRHYGQEIVTRQAVPARLAASAMWLHAWAATLSRLDSDLRSGVTGTEFARNQTAAVYFMDMAQTEIKRCFHDLIANDDDAMRHRRGGVGTCQDIAQR